MALFYRVRCVHTGLPGSPYLSTFSFDVGDGALAQSVVDLVGGFWTGIADRMTTTNTVRAIEEVEVVDESTGDITNTIPVTSFNISGTSGGAAEWTAKQGVLKLRTNTYRAGRRVQGRVFIPAVPSGLGEQVPAGNYVSAISVAGAGLVEDSESNGTPLVVFSRPVGTREGVTSIVTVASCWNQWGVLKSRRT